MSQLARVIDGMTVRFRKPFKVNGKIIIPQVPPPPVIQRLLDNRSRPLPEEDGDGGEDGGGSGR